MPQLDSVGRLRKRKHGSSVLHAAKYAGPGVGGNADRARQCCAIGLSLLTRAMPAWIPVSGTHLTLRFGSTRLRTGVRWPLTSDGVLALVLADEIPADDPLLSGMVVVTLPGERSCRDTLGALGWLADHAADLDATPERLVVAGGSGAACLAATACDAGWPVLHRQVLVHPRFTARHPMPSAVAGVAPATIVHGGAADDDGVRYAALLRRAGVEVEERRR
jgi:hypothetical protein